MNDEPKTHEIDGVQYIEDGHPTASEAISLPLLYDGVPFTVDDIRGDFERRPWGKDGPDLSKTIRLRRLDP